MSKKSKSSNKKYLAFKKYKTLLQKYSGINGFKNFIKKYGIIAISVGFIIAMASLDFIQSLVGNIFLPILRPIISSKAPTWEEMVFTLGPINLRIGPLLSSFLTLIIILFFLYILIDKILKWKPRKR